MRISWPYIQKIIYEQKYNLLVLFLSCILFNFIYSWIFFSSEISSLVDVYITLLPEPIKKLIGLQGSEGFFGKSMIAFGYRHPIILTLFSAIAINLASRYISFEIENKTFDLVLTRPLSRSVIPTHLYFLMYLFLFIALGGLFTGTAAGYFFWGLSEQIVLSDYYKVVANGLLFFGSIGAFSLWIAAMNNERGRALMLTFSILVFLFFFDSIIRLNEEWAFWEPYSFFELYQPVKIVMAQKSFWQPVPYLITINLLFFSLGYYKFLKRDL